MLKTTLTRSAEAAKLSLQKAGSLTDVLSALEGVAQQIDSGVLGLADGGSNRITEHGNNIHGSLSGLASVTRQLNARKIFRVVENLQEELLEAFGSTEAGKQYISTSMHELETFAETYSEYVAMQSGSRAWPLLLAARRLRLSLLNLGEFLDLTLSTSSGPAEATEHESKLTLTLSNVAELRDFAERLLSLSAIYDELCYVLGISNATNPLRVGSIEYGSLWTRLFGETRVIALMISLIESGIRFCHRNYTTEGKYASIPQRVESLEALLDFSNKLKESGVNVDEIQDGLRKNAFTLIDNLNRVVADQPVVEVNGRVHSVGIELEKKFLEGALQSKIAYTKPESATENQPPSDAGAA